MLYGVRARITRSIAAQTAQPVVRALALEGLAASEARPGLGRHGLAMHVPALAPHVCQARVAHSRAINMKP